jgi:DNA-binding NarL/FixJ family response regulator
MTRASCLGQLRRTIMDKPIRILLVDDHALMRAGLRVLLGQEPDLEIVGEAGTGEEAIDRAEQLRPDLVLMDISMPGMGGLEATRRITAKLPGMRVLIVTVHAEEEYLLPVLEAGGSGYVMKQSADTELLGAIRTVARGDVFLYPSGTRLLAQGFRAPRTAREVDPMSLLSDRESVVLRLTAEGYTATEIGERLDISPKTVDTYRQRFMEKLELKHRSEVIRFAVERGLLAPVHG